MTFKAFFIKQELTCCELQNIYFLVNYSLQSMLLKILTLFPVWHFLKGTFIKCVVLRSVFCVRYVEEHIQKTGVAIETQGFTFVTSGRKRESLTGNATLHLYPHFQSLQEITGVADYLSTEISTSKQKRFSLVTFIDTPGLVDGDMKYEFDVEKTLVWLGDHVDLIFVFFDPMGQALCKRTLNIVEKLNEKNGEKLRFYLSKADEAGHESDRQRVMMQIVQELCKRPGLNKCGFDMPTIYIPNPNKPSRCVNQIEEICKTIEKTINLMVQNTLNQLEEDCQTITETVDRKLIDDRDQVIINRKARIRHFLFGSLGFLLPLSFLTAFIISCLSRESLAAVTGENMADNLHFWASAVSVVWTWLSGESQLWAMFLLVCFSTFLILLSKIYKGTDPTLSKKERKKLSEIQNYVEDVMKERKVHLYELYLRQCVSEYDFS
ncbi:uncharacterized protein LOC102357408 isoform X1 [Latimeria chalumnae]|uniref:uncharacterized protein LOC102357408 isoform X1 n=1 Tax=Latimeria chalumnae TaxID=7897 RepID=UPI0006D8F2C9|nr:PREDICTED: uncharacterized protein LOC102357408 isoform X1 [Latimeria chalumnae]|eukprot:XP_014352876.1 PREDICTED: uncharacterized protein LOC102357408 isoform X1 [Latimeria chalumnae]